MKNTPLASAVKKKLKYFDEYSWFRCQRDCETELLVNECGCKAMYMVSPEAGIFLLLDLLHRIVTLNKPNEYI